MVEKLKQYYGESAHGMSHGMIVTNKARSISFKVSEETTPFC